MLFMNADITPATTISTTMSRVSLEPTDAVDAAADQIRHPGLEQRRADDEHRQHGDHRR